MTKYLRLRVKDNYNYIFYREYEDEKPVAKESYCSEMKILKKFNIIVSKSDLKTPAFFKKLKTKWSTITDKEFSKGIKEENAKNSLSKKSIKKAVVKSMKNKSIEKTAKTEKAPKLNIMPSKKIVSAINKVDTKALLLAKQDVLLEIRNKFHSAETVDEFYGWLFDDTENGVGHYIK